MTKLILGDKVKIMVFPAMLHGVMKDNISLWMTVYFVDKFNINLSQSAYFVLFIPVIGFAGRMLYPILYRLCGYQEHKITAYSFAACAMLAAPICFDGISPAVAAVCLSLLYAAVSLINTSLLSIFPIRFLSSGNVASVSGVMDFATYLGAGVSSFIYGFVIKRFGYTPMFVSWAAVSLASVLLLRRLIAKEKPPKTALSEPSSVCLKGDGL